MNEVWLALPTGIGIATVASAVGIGGGVIAVQRGVISMPNSFAKSSIQSLII